MSVVGPHYVISRHVCGAITTGRIRCSLAVSLGGGRRVQGCRGVTTVGRLRQTGRFPAFCDMSATYQLVHGLAPVSNAGQRSLFGIPLVTGYVAA